MAVTANSLILPQGIRTVSTTVVAANSTYTGTSIPTGVLLLGASGANGSFLRRLTAVPNATVTATQLQLFKWNGTNIYLVDTVLMSALTISTTTAILPTDFGYTETNNRFISGASPAWSYYVGISVALASGITFTAELEDL